jgi:hypothetical protein
VAPVLPEGCPRWSHDAEIPMTSLHRFPSGKVEVKMKVVGFDAADGFGRSAAEIFARRQMHGLIHYLQTVGYRGHKLDTHVLASVSRGIGVREERRIVGEYVLTEADARRAAVFADAVAVNTYHLDYHWPDRMQRAGTGITDMLDPHHLPLRMMIPRGAKNLLVPGRGASGDQMAMSAFRVMAVVAQMGYAAGHAARLCLETACDPLRLDVPRLQAAIEAGGQSLDLSSYGEYLGGDRLTDETAVGAARGGRRASGPLGLWQERNAQFVLAWNEAGSRRVAERGERRWQAPRPAAAGERLAPGATTAVLDDGRKAAADTAGGALTVWISSDGGATWPLGRALAPADPAVAPALIATRTGLAVAYAAPDGALKFWHGSAGRIVAGDPPAASLRLDSPPEHVEVPDSLRA